MIPGPVCSVLGLLGKTLISKNLFMTAAAMIFNKFIPTRTTDIAKTERFVRE